ncbi:hypothetical protein B5M42_000135 [Paenibacillus athensensis]|uniref:Uncharacterized protein n=1 Tax=Paenibacillus athensensis TaxID=1967502 RepID=A0A4Y8PS14_9BACL|nr:hypothetical protein [Paenibacillus athensensis]MCD1257242.1 hypothetical protein [Paenibacillus athensensis]
MTAVLDAKLGPGALSDPSRSPYAVSLSDWNSVNGYVNQIVTTGQKVGSYINGIVPAFPELYACATDWQQRTFPNMIHLAKAIYKYGTADVKEQYAKLKQIVDALDNGGSVAAYMPQFTQLIDALTAEVVANESLAATIADAVVRFANAIDKVKRQVTQAAGSNVSARSLRASYDPGGQAGEVAKALALLPGLLNSLMNSPLAKIQLIRGSWTAIKEDLAAIAEAYADGFDPESPFLTELGIELAITQWQQVAGEAQAFAGNVWS